MKKTVLAATVATVAVALPAAANAAKPNQGFVPNTRSQLLALIKPMSKLTPYFHKVSSEGWYCAYYDDAPTATSQNRDTFVAYCIKLTSPKSAKKDQSAS